MTAPLETEQDARNLPEVRAVYSLGRDSGYRTGWREEWARACRAIIEAELVGLDLGAYEHGVILGLSDEPQRCAAIASVIRAAREAGPA